MKEAVYRILNHYLNHNMVLPNLLVIDGGQAQLNFAIDALCIVAYEQTKTTLPLAVFIENALKNIKKNGFIKINNAIVSIISLAKREEEIYFPHKTKTLRFDKADTTLHVLQRVRDESHRFAVTFQRQKRKT